MSSDRFTPTTKEQAVLDSAKVASTKQSYETDALMCQYLALVSCSGRWGEMGGSSATSPASAAAATVACEDPLASLGDTAGYL